MVDQVKNQIFDGPETISEIDIPWANPVHDDFHLTIYKDKFPVSEGHLLFVPKYNRIVVLNIAFDEALRYGKEQVKKQNWDGFNIGMNYGEAAGQTIMWPHIHLIPRRKGDVEDPVGGVRNTIPGKGNYRKK
jgi:ATP adenylyltransferase